MAHKNTINPVDEADNSIYHFLSFQLRSTRMQFERLLIVNRNELQ